MGIKDLWTILTPFCERKPLYELQGKVVAVDLSCWICEAQNVIDYSVQPRMYLRNLYFRTCYLLLMEVTPVFVLEGKAPVLKYQTIAERNAVQFKGSKPKSDKVKTGKDRTRFHFVLKQCEEMLRFMGLACVTGTGEAESMCAYLNADDMVSGCISQDSDCFAYGAKVVYRNFSISHQGSYAACGGAVDVYDIKKANDFLKFGRNKIIALALLCGSDYNDGVHGVGKDSAMKFLNKYDDSEILDRMRSWRKKSFVFDEMENKIADKNICTSCGHFGKVQSHTKSGCLECKTTTGCDFSKYREERLDIKNELLIRKKAIVDANFPSEELINEFLICKDNVKKLDLRWKQPNLVNFVKFTTKFLSWEEIYAFEKFLPILTRWQIFNYEYISKCIATNCISDIKGILYPSYIKKIRNPKGVASYEIIWNDKQNYFNHLIPKEQLDTYKEENKGSDDGLWSTIEPKNLVEKAYPNIVEEFLEKKNKKGKKPTKRKKIVRNTSEIEEINNLLLNTSISEPKPKRTRKKSVKKDDQTNLESYLRSSAAKINLHVDENIDNGRKNKTGNNLNEDIVKSTKLKQNNKKKFEKMQDTAVATTIEKNINKQSTPRKVTEKNVYFSKTKLNTLKKQTNLSTSFDFNASSFGDEDDFDISAIVDDIVSRKHKLPSKIEQLGYYIQEPIVKNDILNQSSFFETNFDGHVDLFEKTLEKYSVSDKDSSDDNTIEYEVGQPACMNEEEHNPKDDVSEDSFEELYVPLYERIKNRVKN